MDEQWLELEEVRNSFGIEKNIFYGSSHGFIGNITISEDDCIPICIYFDETSNDFYEKLSVDIFESLEKND